MVRAQLSRVPEAHLGRDLYVAALNAVSEISEIPAAASDLPGKHFVLFLAFDAREVPDDTILSVARSLLSGGLAYLVAWGPDCERVHDLFDDAEIERELVKESGSVVMTTWHADDSLAEALWFAVVNAIPAEPYDQDCPSVVALAVGNDEWSRAIRDYLFDLPSLNRAVGL